MRYRGHTFASAPAPRRRRTRAAAWLACCLLLAPGSVAAEEGDKPALSDLTFERDQQGIYVTLKVTGAFSPPVRQVLQSGSPLTFRYTIKLRRKRPMWFAKTVLSCVIETRAELDLLSREYLLSRSVDGVEQKAHASREAAVAMAWMTELPRVKIAESEQIAGGETYELLAKAKVQDELLLFVIPWALETPWQRQSLIPTPSAR